MDEQLSLFEENVLQELELDNVIKKVKLGDVWILGEHRLMCGDSTDDDNINKLLRGGLVDMVLTDPPYNTGMVAKEDHSARLSGMFNDFFTEEEWQKFMNDFLKVCYKNLKFDSVAYIFLDWRRSYELIPHIKKYFNFSNLIIWDKIVHGLGSDYKYTYELIHVCKKGKPIIKNRNGDREYQDVWRIQRKIGRDEEHATKKPIELLKRCINHGSNEKEIILDIFGGSGSTLLACEQLNRKCYMMELDPHYCDIIIYRWEKMTGKVAVKED